MVTPIPIFLVRNVFSSWKYSALHSSSPSAIFYASCTRACLRLEVMPGWSWGGMWSIWNSSSRNPSYSVMLFHCRLTTSRAISQQHCSVRLSHPWEAWASQAPSAPWTVCKLLGVLTPPPRQPGILGGCLQRNGLTPATRTFLPGWEECGAHGCSKVRFRQFSGGKD